MTKRRPHTLNPNPRPLSLWLPRVMEGLWLTTLAIVPLVMAPEGVMLFFDVPKVAALRILTGLMAALWAIEWALKPPQGRAGIDGGLWANLRSWIGRDVSRWILTAATLFLIANVLSTLFAPAISVSIWGNEPGRDGFGLYNMASFYILFAVIATHLKTSGQLWRILWVIAGVSTVIAAYAVFQHLGIVPLYESNVDRVQGTFGNALFAGAYFSLTIPLSAAAALAHSMKSRSVWVTAGWTGTIAFQMAAILLTLSRSPWIALAAALAVWMLIVFMITGRRAVMKATILLAGAFAIAMVLSYIPSVSPEVKASDEVQDSGLVERAGSIGLSSNSLNGRLAIWKRAAHVLADRPWFDSAEHTPTFARHLFGYGPDMFLYATPVHWTFGLERDVNASAHNYPLHVLVELGIMGLAAFVSLAAVILVGGSVSLVKNRNVIKPEHGIIFGALIAVVIGRMVEQTTGVARISDLMIFWAIIGIIAAMLPMMRSESGNDAVLEQSPAQSHNWTHAPALRWSVALIAVIAVSLLIFQKNLNYAHAAHLGASAVETFRDRELLASLETMDKAIAAAPDVGLYYTLRADMMNSFGTRDANDEIDIATQQYELNLRGLEANPLSHRARLALAGSALKLAQLGQDGKDDEAIRLYTELARMIAGSDEMYRHLASAHLILGQPQLALNALDEHISVTKGQIEPSPTARYLRGVANQELGNTEDAVTSLEGFLLVAESVNEMAYVPTSHQRLSDLYGELGQHDKQAEHLAKHKAFTGD